MKYTEKDFNRDLNALDGEFQAALIKQAKELTEAGREQVAEKNFALPGDRYPVHDIAHAKNALARVSQHGTPEERKIVREKVYARYPSLKESFEKEHGESPTSKENVAKEEQGNIGKEGSLAGYNQPTMMGTLVNPAADPTSGVSNLLAGAMRKRLLAAKEQGKIGKEAAASCPGGKIRSKGKGRGAGTGKGKGPIGVPMAVRQMAKKKTAQKVPANIAKSPKTSEAEMKKVLNLQQAMKARKTAAEQPGPLTATMGEKGEAIGAAAGLLAGLALGAAAGGAGGRALGATIGALGGTIAGSAAGNVVGDMASGSMQPVGGFEPMTPKMGSFIIGGVKIAAGEESAAEVEGLSNYAGESAEGDQDAAKDLLQERLETRTSSHNEQVAKPPTTTDKVVKEGQYGADPYGGMYGAGGPMDPRVAYMMGMMAQQPPKPTMGEKAKAWLQRNPETYPLAGAALGALAGGVLGQHTGVPGGALGGAGLGAGLGAVGGTMYGQKQGSYEIGGTKIAAAELKPGEVSKKDLKAVFQKAVRTSSSPVRRSFTWDVGDLVGGTKGKEEYKPGTMVAVKLTHPAYQKQAQFAPANPMMQGGDVRYTVGPTPEDVAEYLRTQEQGRRAGALGGLGLGLAGGGALGHMGGGALARGLGMGPTGEAAGEILGTLLGAGAGGYAGGRLGAPAGETIGGMVAEHTTPSAQLETPFLSPGRSEEIAKRLAMAAMLRGGRTPTTAVSPG